MTQRTMTARSHVSVFSGFQALQRDVTLSTQELGTLEPLFCSSWLCSRLFVACQGSISRKPNKPWLSIRQPSRTSDLVAPQWHCQQDQQPGLVATPKASIIPEHPANKVVTQLNFISLIPPEDLFSSGYSHIDKKILSHWTCLLTTAVTPALTSDLIWIFKSIVDHKFKWFSYPLKALFS